MAEHSFAKALEHVLAFEGGYVDHKDDPGGATNMGITRKTLAEWRGVKPWVHLPKQAVKDLTREEAGAIYKARYWSVSGAGQLPAGLDLAVFDFAVNSGPARAVRTLQCLVGALQDGVFGPKTLSAVQVVCAKNGVSSLTSRLCNARLRFLEGLGTYSVFGRGWSRRVARLREISVAMAAEESKSSAKRKGSLMAFLSGYKTYIMGVLMLLSGLGQAAGLDLPGFDGQNALELVMEGLAIVFMRKGIKTELA